MTTATDHSVDMNHPTYYHPYPTYKASGVEWLGEVPEGWELRPIFAMYQRRIERDHPDEQLLSVYREYGVVPREGREDNYNRPSEDLSSYQLVKPRDLAINKMKTWQGSVAISEYQGIVSPAYIICRPTHTEHDRFLHYLLRSPRYIVRYGQLSYGVRVGQWDMRFEDFRRIEALIPPLPEQRAIAAFLDHKTAEIDALIAAKERLIALLREKRAALITSAVTKGLDPDVAMKDSGVEWLGEVPEGWEIKRAKFIFQRVQRPVREEDEVVTAFRDGAVTLRSNRRTEGFTFSIQEIGYQGIRKGDLVVHAMDGFAGAIGVSDSDGKATPVYTVLRPLNEGLVNNNYYGYLLRDLALAGFVNALAKGIRERSTEFRYNEIKELWLPVLPYAEQTQVVNFVEREKQKLDSLVSTIQQAIDYLKEYRTALISAAVTGKIDVRNL